jgi:hypothetical protein
MRAHLPGRQAYVTLVLFERDELLQATGEDGLGFILFACSRVGRLFDARPMAFI